MNLIFIFTFSIFLNCIICINNSPIIGILTQPANYPQFNITPKTHSYIAGSYVHHLQSAGAQVIPIQWDLPAEELESLFYQINGIFFPGGGANLTYISGNQSFFTPFTEAAKALIELLLDANSHGDYFPLTGVCLGYETINMVISNNASILVEITTGENVAKNLFPVINKNESFMYHNMDDDLYAAISNQNLAYFHHSYTVDPNAWVTNSYLAGNFTVNAITNDTVGSTYPTSIEGKSIPIFGTQFHPEKDTYEWSTNESIPHQRNGIRFQQYFANLLVNQSRLNNHFMSQESLMKYSIYNFKPRHIGVNAQFEEIYFFENYNTSGIIVG